MSRTVRLLPVVAAAALVMATLIGRAADQSRCIGATRREPIAGGTGAPTVEQSIPAGGTWSTAADPRGGTTVRYDVGSELWLWSCDRGDIPLILPESNNARALMPRRLP